MVRSRLFVFLFYSFCDADGTSRTDEAAEVTADTLCANQTGPSGFFVEDDGLVAAVATRYFTASAPYAQIHVELGIDDGVAVQTVGMQELLQTLANQLL
jgi:hypothetical protein